MYEVFQMIGKGGSSKVKMCRKHGLDADLAVKIIRCDDIEKLFIVMEEIKILKIALHPNIV